MDDRDLVRMANQITAFFSAYPKFEALDGIGKHLHLFWDPRMRNAICENLAQAEAEGLSPLVAAAVRTLAHQA